MKIRAALFILAGLASSAMAGPATVSPPQGYIGLEQNFESPNPQQGFYNIDFRMTFASALSGHRGTFWSNQFTFQNSSAGLPANHTGGNQGGYLGLQVLADGSHLAIFSSWWATSAKAAAGAACVSQVEMYYTDGRPFEPPITDATRSDPKRKVDGGPFRSCRLPVVLAPGVPYRLRIWKTGDGNKSGGNWWGAWLINERTKEEKQIGELQVPRAWGGLSPGSVGFMEQFGPMPKGCASIPASTSMFLPATADAGSHTAKLSTNVYGACEKDVTARYRTEAAPDGGINVVVK